MNTKGQRSSHRERLQRPVTMIVRLSRSINHDRHTGSEKPAAGVDCRRLATPFLRQRTPGAFSS